MYGRDAWTVITSAYEVCETDMDRKATLFGVSQTKFNELLSSWIKSDRGDLIVTLLSFMEITKHSIHRECDPKFELGPIRIQEYCDIGSSRVLNIFADISPKIRQEIVDNLIKSNRTEKLADIDFEIDVSRCNEIIRQGTTVDMAKLLIEKSGALYSQIIPNTRNRDVMTMLIDNGSEIGTLTFEEYQTLVYHHISCPETLDYLTAESRYNCLHSDQPYEKFLYNCIIRAIQWKCPAAITVLMRKTPRLKYKLDDHYLLRIAITSTTCLYPFIPYYGSFPQAILKHGNIVPAFNDAYHNGYYHPDMAGFDKLNYTRPEFIKNLADVATDLMEQEGPYEKIFTQFLPL